MLYEVDPTGSVHQNKYDKTCKYVHTTKLYLL